MSTEVEIKDIAAFQSAIANVRNDSSPVNWMLANHAEGNPNVVSFLQSGTGGASDMSEHLSDAEVMYGIVRLEEKVDMSITVKFLYIHWVGENVPFAKRGKFGVVHGSVIPYFEPTHCVIETSHRDEVTEEAMMKRLQDTSGTKSKEIDKEVAATRQDRGFTSSSNVIKTGKTRNVFQVPKGVDVEMDDSVREAIADVRSDETQTNWCVAGYEGNNPKNPLVLIGKGSEGLDGVVAAVSDNSVGYSLFRTTDVVDEIVTVKFVFITWVGESVKPMTKGKISSHKSTINKYFSPAHVVIYATNKAELSEQGIMEKVQSASGSKSHVR